MGKRYKKYIILLINPTSVVRGLDYLTPLNFLGVRLTISCIKDKRGRSTGVATGRGGFNLCSVYSNHWKSINDGSFALTILV
ncbi:hypothetical protein FOA20_25300 [Peribacillus simplex]